MPNRQPADGVPRLTVEQAELIQDLRRSRFFSCSTNGCRTETPKCDQCKFVERIIAALTAPPEGAQPTAGDLFFAALDEWFQHGSGCAADECETCTLLLNRVRLAQKVHQNSSHKRLSAEGAQGWQPIATAPTDGTPVLVCVRGYDGNDEFGWKGRAPFTAYFGNYHPNAPGKGEWRDDSGHRRPHITHWMPLPAPPETAP